MDIKIPDDSGQLRLNLARGGARAGAGRKKSGFETRAVRISLDPAWWEIIEQISAYRKQENPKDTQSELFRDLLEPLLAAIQDSGPAVNQWAEASKNVDKLRGIKPNGR